MRKVILAMQVTLDGFIEGPNGELDWAMNEDVRTATACSRRGWRKGCSRAWTVLPNS